MSWLAGLHKLSELNQVTVTVEKSLLGLAICLSYDCSMLHMPLLALLLEFMERVYGSERTV